MRKPEVSPTAALAAALALLAGSITVAGVRRALAPAVFDPPPALFPDVNRAPARTLLLLPGLGAVRARDVVAERARGGPFKTLDDLARVHGIGARTVDRLRGLATAGDRGYRSR